MVKTMEERFWQKVQITPGCWIWKGCISKKGYGQFSVYKRKGSIMAHRTSWEMRNKTIPRNMQVCHSCDNPPCVNPAHLFLGTNQDNQIDSSIKGRNAFGSKHPNAKLTWNDVRSIRASFPSINKNQLSKRFKVDYSVITGILENKRWKEKL